MATISLESVDQIMSISDHRVPTIISNIMLLDGKRPLISICKFSYGCPTICYFICSGTRDVEILRHDTVLYQPFRYSWICLAQTSLHPVKSMLRDDKMSNPSNEISFVCKLIANTCIMSNRVLLKPWILLNALHNLLSSGFRESMLNKW